MTSPKQIREKMKTIVVGLPTSGIKSIFKSRLMGIDARTQIPSVMIYFDDGTIERSYDDVVENDAMVNVEIFASDASNVDDILDDFRAIIEPAFKADKTLGGLVEQLTLKAFGYNRDDNSSLASLTLSYRVVFEN